MDSILETLKTIKECIEEINNEIDSLEKMENIHVKEMPEYLSSIKKIQESILNLYNLLNPKVPAQHVLRLEYINHIKIRIDKLNQVLQDCNKWHETITNWKCCDLSCWEMLTIEKPSEIEEKIITTFKEVDPILKEMIQMEKDILGSSIQIKHPILQKAWIAGLSASEINSNNINAQTLAETLLVMLKIEEASHLEKEDYCKKMILTFVKYLDLSSGFEPDEKITINDMNSYKITEENTSSIKGLLGISKQPKSEEIEQNIKVYFPKPITVNYLNTKRDLDQKYSVGYGSDNFNEKVCEFIIDSYSGENKDIELFGIEINCKANDQGFGGTCQTHMRYQINENMSVNAFWVNRDKTPSGEYSFTIGPDKVKIGDTIKIFLFCPTWNGWSITLRQISAKAKFI